MTPEELVDAVTTETNTALSRLGSSKALYAATNGELDATTVLEAAADAEYHAATTYDQWADTEADDRAQEVWASTVAEERDHYDRVVAELDDGHDPGDPPPIHAHLRSLSDPIERGGAFLGRTLAADRSKAQYTGYFVGQANPGLADLFRDLGADLDTQQTRGEALLAELCTTEDDWATAETAAVTTIETAYDTYVDTLESLGVDPKPVC